MEGWLVQIFPAEFGFKWTDHIVDGVRDDDQHHHHNILIAIIQPQDGPLKCSLHREITGKQKRVTCPLRPLIIKSGIVGKTQNKKSSSYIVRDGLGNLCFDLWNLDILSHSYLPNLQVLLLLPSFATLVYTIYGYPQKCPSYLTHICPISKFSFSYLPLPTYYIWLPPTNITFTRNANIHGFCFLDELIQTLSLKQW